MSNTASQYGEDCRWQNRIMRSPSVNEILLRSRKRRRNGSAKRKHSSSRRPRRTCPSRPWIRRPKSDSPVGYNIHRAHEIRARDGHVVPNARSRPACEQYARPPGLRPCRSVRLVRGRRRGEPVCQRIDERASERTLRLQAWGPRSSETFATNAGSPRCWRAAEPGACNGLVIPWLTRVGSSRPVQS